MAIDGPNAFMPRRPMPPSNPPTTPSAAKPAEVSRPSGSGPKRDDFRKVKAGPQPSFRRKPRFRGGQRPGRPGRFSSIANNASQALHGLGGLHTVIRSAANGDRPVAVHVPHGADKDKPFDLVMFFHGKGGHVDEVLNRAGLAGNLRQHGRLRPNSIFVLPQGHTRERYHHWMSRDRGESLRKLSQEVLHNVARLLETNEIQVGKIVLKAHSGGGAVFKNALDAGELNADRIDFLDAMYADWGQQVAAWALRPENSHVEFGVVYSPHQQSQVRTFRKTLAGHRQMHIERARVGHSQIPHRYWTIRPAQR